MEANRKKLFTAIGKILKIPESKISESTSPDNTETWDSFSGLLISAEVEKIFKIKFTIDEIISTKNVGDILKNIRNHKILI